MEKGEGMSGADLRVEEGEGEKAKARGDEEGTDDDEWYSAP